MELDAPVAADAPEKVNALLPQASTTTELGEEADSTEGSASWRTFIPKQFRQWQTAAASRLPSLLTTSQAPQVCKGRAHIVGSFQIEAMLVSCCPGILVHSAFVLRRQPGPVLHMLSSKLLQMLVGQGLCRNVCNKHYITSSQH